MVGQPIRDKSLESFKDIIKNILKNKNFVNTILNVKIKWKSIEVQEKAQNIIRENGYYAKAFGREAEEAAIPYLAILGFESYKGLLIDEKHEKDLRIGDFLLPLYICNGAISCDTKFCFTDVLNCFGSITIKSSESFNGWYVCFGTNCDAALSIYSEYFREQLDEHKITLSNDYTSFLYKDYKFMIEEGIRRGCSFIVSNEN